MRNPYPYPPVTFGDSPLGKGAFKGETLVFRAAVGDGVPDVPNCRGLRIATAPTALLNDKNFSLCHCRGELCSPADEQCSPLRCKFKAPLAKGGVICFGK